MITFIKAFFIMLQTPPTPGPPNPLGMPIDSLTIYLLVTAVVLGFTFFLKNKKVNR